MNFYGWLERQIERNDPVGDLARDARDDIDITLEQKRARSLKEWKQYIRHESGNWSPVMRAFRMAANEYQKEGGRS